MSEKQKNFLQFRTELRVFLGGGSRAMAEGMLAFFWMQAPPSKWNWSNWPNAEKIALLGRLNREFVAMLPRDRKQAMRRSLAARKEEVVEINAAKYHPLNDRKLIELCKTKETGEDATDANVQHEQEEEDQGEDAAASSTQEEDQDSSYQMKHTVSENADIGAVDFSYKITVAAIQGGRRYMEDRVHIEAVRDIYGNLSHLYAAVYDGHGGAQASEYVRQNLHNNIKSSKAFYSKNDDEVLMAIRQAFIKTHHNMQKMLEHWPMTHSGFPCTAGTTASVLIIRKGKIYTGHVGDSVIVMANCLDSAVSANKITEDHKPDSESERNRIEKTGGGVAVKAGVHRVIWKRPIRGHLGPIRRSTTTENIPFLAVARALGDFWSLNPENNEYVVSPDPDVSVVQLQPTDEFIVLASDGLTNVMRPQQMAENLRTMAYSRFNVSSCDFLTKNQNIDPNYAQFMLKEALDGWRFVRADNISVICIQLINNAYSPPASPKMCDGERSQHCVFECSFMNIDKEFTDFPAAMIHVKEKTSQRYLTNPVKFIYNSAMNGVGEKDHVYKGPGFIVPQMPRLSNEEELSDDEISVTNDYFPLIQKSNIHLFSAPEASVEPKTNFNFFVSHETSNFSASVVTPNSANVVLQSTPSISSIYDMKVEKIKVDFDVTALETKSVDEEERLMDVAKGQELRIVNKDYRVNILPIEKNETKPKKPSTVRRFLSQNLTTKLAKSPPSKSLKSSIKKKCGFNEKLFSKCHSFGETVFNDFLSNSSFSSSSKSYTVTKKDHGFCTDQSTTNSSFKKIDEADVSTSSSSRFSSFVNSGFLRSGKIFSSCASSPPPPNTSKSSFELFSSSVPLPSSPKVSASTSSAALPSSLLSPFAVLATVRSSASLLRTSNSDIILTRKRFTPSALHHTPLALQQNLSLRPPPLNYEKTFLFKDNVEDTESTSIPNNSSPFKTQAKNSPNDLILTPKLIVMRSVSNEKQQPSCLSSRTKKNAACVDLKDVYKFPPNDSKCNKLISTISSLSSASALSRKRLNCGGLLPEGGDYASECTPLRNNFAESNETTSSAAKRIRLSRQISGNKAKVADGFTAVILPSPNASKEEFDSIVSDSLPRSDRKSKRQQSRGIWNFVSSVFSKYIS